MKKPDDGKSTTSHVEASSLNAVNQDPRSHCGAKPVWLQVREVGFSQLEERREMMGRMLRHLRE